MKDESARPEWFYTAPCEQVMVRRGDPLGFRRTADWYADLLAPGLSNRTFDARWLTILLWILHQANSVWQRFFDGESLDTAEAARRFYEWVKPLELLWVARTAIHFDPSGRQLPGIQAIKRWLAAKRNLPQFGLSPDQYRRYRQASVYGAYRVMLREVGSLTRANDGFRPHPKCQQLIDLVDRYVPKIPLPKHLRGRMRDPARYWTGVSHAWDKLRAAKLFPTTRRERPSRLTPEERQVLFPAIFGDSSEDSRRRCHVAQIIGKSRAKNHTQLCVALAGRLDDKGVDVLPHFSRLADAGVDAMDAVWKALSDDPKKRVSQLSKQIEVVEKLQLLSEAARSWKKLGHTGLEGESVVQSLADAACGARTGEKSLLALVQHHEQYGGGLHWFKLTGNNSYLVQIAPQGLTESSRYRFRLYALGRLAVQCGVIRQLPLALGYTPDEEE